MVKIGLIADTHDNQEAAEKAVELFNQEEVEHVLHAGDLVSPFTASKFANLDAEFHFVWGNNEGDRIFTTKKLKDINAEPAGEFQSLSLDGKNIALIHGENEEVVDALAESEKYDAVVRGHTHNPGVEEDPLVVNPGAASGYLCENRTVAILDTEKMKVEIKEI